MRLAIVFSVFLAAVVEATRRPPSAPLKADIPRMWGYPYGWGISDEDEPEYKEDIQEIKPVKRAKPKTPAERLGWVSHDVEKDPHVHVKDVSDLMDWSLE